MTATPNTVAKTIAKKKVALSPKARRAVNTLINAKRDEAEAKARKSRAEAIIRAELGDEFEVGTTADGITLVTVQHSTNSKVDRDLLATLFPGAVEQTTVRTPYSFLKTA